MDEEIKGAQSGSLDEEGGGGDYESWGLKEQKSVLFGIAGLQKTKHFYI